MTLLLMGHLYQLGVNLQLVPLDGCEFSTLRLAWV